MKKIIIITSILLLAIIVPLKANLPTGIAKAFKGGDADKVSEYFEETLEMSILGNRSMYSKAQAKLVLGDFFDNNKPTSLVEKHNGGRGNSKFSVFNFSSDNESFRATIFYKGNANETRISQITIEKDTGF